MLDMKKDIEAHVNALKVMAHKAVAEMAEIKKILDEWGSEAFGARITNDTELKEILLAQLNELIAPQKIDTFDEASSIVAGMTKQVTDDVIEMAEEIPAMITFSAMMGIDRMCPECHGQLDLSDEWCPHCGKHIVAKVPYEEPTVIEMKTCSCGRRHHSSDKFCPACGQSDEPKELTPFLKHYKEEREAAKAECK